MIYKKKNVQSNIVQIILSFSLSLLFIWVVGFFFCNSLFYYQYDDRLMKMIHSPNIVYKHRSEGIAKTYKGLFGINAIKDITKDSRKKIVIWGDSYVEALQVNDNYKMPQVITAKLSNKGLGENLMCFGVGMNGDSVADYYFGIPKYEQLTKNIISHFIIIANIRDILPNQPTDIRRGIFKSNPFTLYQDNWKPKHQKIKKILNDFHLYFIWEPVKSFLLSVNKLHFIHNTRHHNANVKESKKIVYSDKFLFDSWSFLFKKLREQTELPIIFVYSPEIPIIQNGKISVKDNDANHIALFTKIAKKYNMSVLNTTEAFISFYKKTGLFPRGFSNSKPSEGHFNKNGHKIVSEIITTHIITAAKK